MASTATISILLVGKTGSGKSSSGNMILQREAFDDSPDFSSVTQECSQQSSNFSDKTVKVMDTPGLFDTERSHEEVGFMIVQCAINMHPGPDVIFYVIRIGEKYTAKDFAAYRRFKMLLGSSVTQHMIVLFTGGDKLAKSGKTLEQFVQSVPDNLQKVIKECAGRYAVLNNELRFEEGQTQVADLLKRVQQLRRENGNKLYTCKSYDKITCTMEQTETLKKEVNRRLQEIEVEEARATKYYQEQEDEFKEKLGKLKLEQEECDKRMEDFKKEMKEEKQKWMEAWFQKKDGEERALEAKKKEEERKRLEEREKHERKLREKRAEQERKLQEENKERREQQEREKKERERQRQEEEEERNRRKRKQEMEIELARKREAAIRRERERMVNNLLLEAAVGVVELSLRAFFSFR